VAIQDDKLFPFIIVQTLQGAIAVAVTEIISTKDHEPSPSVTLLDRSIKPFQLSKGSLTFLTQSGTLQAQYLSSHSHINDWNQFAG